MVCFIRAHRLTMLLTPHQAQYIAHDLTLQRMAQKVRTEHLFTLLWALQ